MVCESGKEVGRISYPLETSSLGNWQNPESHSTMVHLQVPGLERILKTNHSTETRVAADRKSPCGPEQWVALCGVMPLLEELPQHLGHVKPQHPMPSISGTSNPRVMVLNFPPVKRNRYTLNKTGKCSASCSPGFVNSDSFLLFYICNMCHGKMLVLSSNIQFRDNKLLCYVGDTLFLVRIHQNSCINTGIS